MYQIYGLLLFIATPWLAQAQYEKFLKDPDITWAAEIEITYSLKPPPAADPLWENDICYWKSFDPKAAVQYEGGEMLVRKMLEAARSGAWPAWQRHNMAMQILPTDVLDSLYYRNTIVTFDVVTFEEIIKVVQDEFDPAYFTAIRARQLLYFDHKKGEFGLATLAVAPVFAYIRKLPPNRWQLERNPASSFDPGHSIDTLSSCRNKKRPLADCRERSPDTALLAVGCSVNPSYYPGQPLGRGR